jgi:hypothetical protein
MTDFNIVETDPDVNKAIVMSLRMYIDICRTSGKLPQMGHMVEIAFALDAGTKALIEATKIGADDDEDTE